MKRTFRNGRPGGWAGLGWRKFVWLPGRRRARARGPGLAIGCHWMLAKAEGEAVGMYNPGLAYAAVVLQVELGVGVWV